MYQDSQPDKYDPVKAHAYYEAHKKLKGRSKSSASKSSTKSTSRPHNTTPLTKRTPKMNAAHARIGRLRSAIQKLQGALSEAEAALSAKRQTARKTRKANSDGKTTVKERTTAKKYRDKHQAELKSKDKKKTAPSSSSSNSVSGMSVQELTARVIKLRSALGDAKKQLATAQHELGQLAHTAITSDPDVDIHFAQFAISRKDSVT